MLIKNNSLNKGDVVVLKVRNIEGEVVGRLEADYKGSATGGGQIKLSRVILAHAVQQQGGIGLAFLPFSLSAPDDHVFEFDVAELMVPPFHARDEVKQTYLSQTTSLELPTTNLQV